MEQEPKEYADSPAEEAARKAEANEITQGTEVTEVEDAEVKGTDVRVNETDDKPDLLLNGSLPEKKKAASKRQAIIKDIITYAIIFVVCLYVIPTFVIQKTIVDGPSMENNLHNGEQLMVEKISYHLNALKRFDIIVFYPYGRQDKEDYFVKRVIGLPGETVQIKGKDIYINGNKITEHYGKQPITKAGIAANPITLADDEYFVLGDNRKVSFDSRYSDVGPVKKKNIGGRVLLRVWPLNKFGIPE